MTTTTQKKRVLLVNEFSELNTGFSVMGKDLFTRLYKTDKYELCELASYIKDDDPRIKDIPWKVVAAQPAESNAEGSQDYFANYNQNQFGAYKFENTVLDFQPDVVISWRDYWHDEFITNSPYRNKFFYIWSACVDSEPPKTEWINRYSTVDLITSYTKWGLTVLDKYGGNNNLKLAPIDVMPGVDLNIFAPMDKSKIREKYGLKNDINIYMMCARNQMRKMFPDLIRGFMNSIDQLYASGKDSVADNTFLYFHTGITDIGWNILEEIRKYNASHKVLLTYICANCKHTFISFARGAQCHCLNCNELTAITPNTGIGVDKSVLAELYNLADLYVQVQIAGALEIPIVEAKACGIPTLAVNYAAPFELQNLSGSFDTIDVKYFRQESKSETGQFRGYPDVEDITRKLTKFAKLKPEQKTKLQKQSRQSAEEHLSADLTAQKWMDLIDSTPQFETDRWLEPPNYININPSEIPWHFGNNQFARYLCQKYIPRMYYQNSYLYEKEILEKLSLGFHVINNKSEPYTKENAVKEIAAFADRYNHFELHRYNMLVIKPNEVKPEIAYEVI